MFDLNYWAVLVAGLSYWLIGGLWDAGIFGKQYQASLNFDEAEKQQAQKDFPKALATHFISGLITSFFLANFVRAAGSTSFVTGIGYGALAWLAFAFTINLNYLMFERRPVSLFMLNNGFFLIAFALMCGILSVWR